MTAPFPVLVTGPGPLPPAPHPGGPGVTRVWLAAALAPARGGHLAAGTYAIRVGDTLSGIAGRYCSTAGAWPALAAASRIPDPDLIYPGGTVTLDCTATAAYTPRHTVRRTWARQRDGDGDHDGDTTGAPRSSGRHTRWHQAPAAQPAARAAYGTRLTYAQLEQLWVSAGGPAWAQAAAAAVAECESGGNTRAYNPSSASGLWQILGQVVPGNIFDPYINALNAAAKFRASGNTWAQWACKA